jgi:hypothetical protein
VAVSLFTIFFEALLAHRAMDPPTSSSFADKKRVRSLSIGCSLRSLRLALFSRCLPLSLRSLVQDSGAPAWLSTAGERYRRSQSVFRVVLAYRAVATFTESATSSSIQRQQILDRFAPDERPDPAGVNGNDRRPRDMVVITRH